MKYLLTLFVVLAMAAPAMSDCNTQDAPDLTAVDDSDTYLPASQTNVVDLDCNKFTWKFTFDRTDQIFPIVTIYVTIDNTDLGGGSASKAYVSSSYTILETHVDGPNSGSIDRGQTDNKMWITRSGANDGGFEIMKLEAYDYVQ